RILSSLHWMINIFELLLTELLNYHGKQSHAWMSASDLEKLGASYVVQFASDPSRLMGYCSYRELGRSLAKVCLGNSLLDASFLDGVCEINRLF
ncbi:hypothetical protein C5167_011337, partial [Papaver somniferum]